MSEKDKKFSNPRDEFLFMLNKDLENIYMLLCQHEHDPEAMIRGTNMMAVFIQRLDIDDDPRWKNMRWLKRNWTPALGFSTDIFHKNATGYISYSRRPEMTEIEIFGIWSDLSNFMNGSYFKGWSGAQPKEATPKGKGIGE